MNELHDAARYSIAGIRVDAITRPELLGILEVARQKREKRLILNHNLHSLYLYLTMPEFSELYAHATDIYIDGMPVLWMGKLAGLPLRSEQRITFLDCLDDILLHAQAKGWRIFHLGSSKEVSMEGVSLLRERYPDLAIAGHDGYISLDGEDTQEVIGEINRFNADILLVGMGMPLQEFWIGKHLASLNATGIFTCGATLEYVTGHSYKPPAWAGPLGFYGIMRMLHDPKRLWRRYLIEPIVLGWKLFVPLVRQRLRGSISGCALR